MSQVREMNQHYMKGIDYYDQGLYRQAIVEFEGIATECGIADPACRLARFYLGESYANLALDLAAKGASDEAELDLRLALKVTPDYPDLHYHLGRLLLDKGDCAQAEIEFEAAVALNPRYGKALFDLGLLKYRNGDRDAGIDQIGRAVEMEQGFSVKDYQRALLAHKADQWDIAQEALDELASTNVDDISYHFLLGKDQFKRGDYESAIVEFERALSVQPGYADIRNWLGMAYMAIGDSLKALEQFNQALDANPRFTSASLNAGSALISLGREAAARDCLRQVLAIDPDNEEARTRLAEL
jgi:tetratricopeptide (TPR) repeat protein